STMDIMHVYEVSKKVKLMEPVTQQLSSDYAAFNDTVAEMVHQARRDLTADGFDPDSAAMVLELDMLYGGQFHVKRALSPRMALGGPGDVAAICAAFEKEFSEAFSPFVVNPEGGVFIESFIFKAIIAAPKIDLPKLALEGNDPSAARKGERPVFWTGKDGFTDTTIYAMDALRPGNVVRGPAVIESEYTTLVVPDSMTFSIDNRGLGILEG